MTARPFSKCQEKAQKKLSNHLEKDTEKEFLLTGGGGVGKTYLLQKIINKYRGTYFFCVAPTHKATSVLREKIKYGENSEILTLAKFLGLKQEYDENGQQIFKTNNTTKYFIKKKENHNDTGKEFNYCLIVDECSMINDKYLSYIRSVGIKVIYIGDSYQLPPIDINSKIAKISPIFLDEKMKNYEMKTMMRTANNDLMTLYKVLRQCVDTLEDPKEYINYFDRKTNIKWMTKNNFIRALKKTKNKTNSMVIAYSGQEKKVGEYNKLIKDRKKGQPKYMEGDKMMFDNFYNHSKKRFNTGHLFNICNVEQTEEESKYFDKTFIIHKIEIDDDEIKINKIHENDRKIFLDSAREKRNEIKKIITDKQLSKDEITILWREYFTNYNNLDAPITDAYAITCHKAQGSTYEEVYIDMTNIEWCIKKSDKNPNIDEGMIRRAIYTAVSRASKKVYIYCNLFNVKKRTPKKKCGSCHNNKKVEDFINDKGKEKKCCYDCRIRKKN